MPRQWPLKYGIPQPKTQKTSRRVESTSRRAHSLIRDGEEHARPRAHFGGELLADC
jgi:hypothetical protein